MFELTPYSTRRSVYDPFNFFSDFFGTNNAPMELRTDISYRGDAFVLEADLPGFRKEDIDLHLEDNVLTITAKHQETAENKQDGKYICREHRVGSYARYFDVSGIQAEGISAASENGVLPLLPPQQSEVVPPRRQVTIP